MWLFLIFCLLCVQFKPFVPLSTFQTELMLLQHTCFHLSPFESEESRLWEALVCGRSLKTLEFWSTSLKASGLIHIFVVSGSHFLVLRFLLEKLKLPHFFVTALLWLFNGFSGFSAPGTRACMQTTTHGLLRMQPHQNLFVASLMCLALHPPWIESYSFWLSWLASLILFTSPQDPLKIMTNSIFFSVWCFLGFSISLWSWLLNIFIAPIIGWVLFPLALLALVPACSSFFAVALQGLELLLRYLGLHDFEASFRFPALVQISFIVLTMQAGIQLYHLSFQGRRLR